MLDVWSHAPRTNRRVAVLSWFLFALLPAVASAQSTTVTAMWDPSPPTEQVSSYEVCTGTSSLSCNVRLASVSASQSSYVFSPPAGQMVYVAVRALNSKGRSPYSTEQRFSIPSLGTLTNRSTSLLTAILPISLSVSDPDGSSLTFTHTGLPPGVSINSKTGQISGTPTSAGTFNVTIFVSDGLVTVSRSFLWTVTTGTTTDRTAPGLTITSHASGLVVTSANQTIRGTATDSGKGGSGISIVRVNGQSATGGTASGSNTANWSKAITLSSGSNTISVEAVDGAGNLQMQQITLQLSTSGSGSGGSGSGSTTLAITSLTSNVASPQSAGKPITFSVGVTGGVAPQQFKFLVQQGSGTAQTVQNWSTSKTYTWTPAAAGNYTVTVWGRNAGVTTNAAQASAQMTYSIIAGGVSALSVSPSSGSGSGRTFTLRYSDSRGASNLTSEWIWFAGGTGVCTAYHERATNRVYLINDAGTAWSYNVLGTNSVLRNSYCAVNLASSSVSISGSVLTLNLSMTFRSTFNGGKTIRMFANAAGGLYSGWQDRGSWTVIGN